MTRMTLRAAITMLLAGALLIAAGLPDAVALAAPPSKCQKLKGRDIAPASSVKLVQRANGDDGTDLIGCVLPRGPVQRIASSADFYTTVESYSIKQIAGRAVMIESGSSSQYAYSRSLYVHHLRTRRSYAIARTCEMLGGDDCASAGSSVATAAFVTPKGRAVALVARAGVATVTAFNTLGTARALDSGPLPAIEPASLALTGNLASWVNAGVARSALIAPG